RALDKAARASDSDLASENRVQISPSKSPKTYSSNKVSATESWPLLIASSQMPSVFQKGSARLLTRVLVVLRFVWGAVALSWVCTPTSSNTSSDTTALQSDSKSRESIRVYWRPYP